jgi:hypothetical protein
MAVSLASNMIGRFTEKEFGKQFSFMLNPDPKMAPAFPYLIVVGPNADETRLAVIKKTVAYVVVDESTAWEQDGGLVIEKWQIKKKVMY